MPVLSTRIVLDCFYLLIFYSEKFSTDVCRLPYAVDVNLNLSNIGGLPARTAGESREQADPAYSGQIYLLRNRAQRNTRIVNPK